MLRTAKVMMSTDKYQTLHFLQPVIILSALQFPQLRTRDHGTGDVRSGVGGGDAEALCTEPGVWTRASGCGSRIYS